MITDDDVLPQNRVTLSPSLAPDAQTIVSVVRAVLLAATFVVPVLFLSDKSITATCPAGKTIIGGGGSTSAAVNDDIPIAQSEPGTLTSGKAVTWVVAAREIGSVSGNWTVTAKAVCATG